MNRPKTKVQMAKAHHDEERLALHRKYRAVYGTPDGKVVIDDIMNRICGYRGDVMSTNPMAVYIQGTRHDIANAVSRMLMGVTEQPTGTSGARGDE